jgi:hypothetical protein
METRTVEQVESWSTRSFADGFAGLHELSDGEFSGAVRAGGAWLFMLNGRIIGVYEGTLDDFEDADGTAYAAPHPSLPLLFSMKEKGGDTRAKYYTNDTPLSEVDSTLSEGSFTGYVELSENVLSGDYYVAYYGGRSMSVAFVGASEQVVTGDEAFERAEDEVGIYEVRDVEIEVTDVPEPDTADEPDTAAGGSSSGGTSSPSGGASEPSGGAGAPSGASGGATDSPAGDSAADRSAAGQSSASEGTEASGHSGHDTTSTGTTPGGVPSSNEGASQDEGAGQSTESQASPSAGPEQAQSATDAIRQPEAKSGTTDAEKTTDASTSAGVESKPEQGETSAEAGSEVSSTETAQAESADAGASASADDDQSTVQSDRSTDEADAFSEEQEWREATTIPSLDPDRSERPEAEKSRQKKASAGTSSTGKPSGTSTNKQSGTSASTGSKSARADSGSATSSKSQGSDGSSAKGRSGGQAANASDTASGGASKSPGNDSKSSGNSPNASGGTSAGGSEKVKARIGELKSQLDQRKQQVQQLKERLSKIESERDEYERERDALRQEVQRLEARLENAESAGDGSASGGRQLARAQAFDGTNLFVRYQSKGKATLEEAAEGKAEYDDVNANLQLEHHTQFEADDVSVNGRPFEEFLTDSFEHQFVSWIIEELLYEIRDTGHRNDLRDLYESIPKIDRVDLHGSVSAGGDEDDTRKESFDVIMRNRMGNPLLVADLNDSRDPTTGEMMGSLVDASSGVAEAHDELAGAFQVTESFFEPEALETAESATSGSFLSREKRESFVKLSRKRGYHLCLVESRSGGFHLNVPEL